MRESNDDNILERFKDSDNSSVRNVVSLFENVRKKNYEISIIEELLITMNKIVIVGGVLLASSITLFVWILAMIPILSSSLIIEKIYQRRIREVEKAIKESTNEEDIKNMKIYLKSLKNKCLLSNHNKKIKVKASKEESYRRYASANGYRDWETDRKSTRLNSSHSAKSRMPSSA